MKKVFWGTIGLVYIIMLFGCQSMPTDSETGSGDIENYTSHISQQIGNTIINADISMPNSKNISSIDITFISIPIEDAKSVFLDEEIIVEETTHDSGYALRTNDDDTVVATDAFFAFNSYFSRQIESVLALDNGFESITIKAQGLADNIDFEFSTRDEACQSVSDLLRRLGFANIGKITIYALSYQKMAIAEDRIMNNPDYEPDISSGRLTFKNEWGTDDDCYYLTIETELQGIPVISNGFYIEQIQTFSFGGQIRAIYSKDGLCLLHIPALYQETGVNTDALKIISPIDAVNQVANRLNSIITNNTFNINTIELRYISEYIDSSRNQMQLIPVWALEVEENITVEDNERGSPTSFVQSHSCYVNAVSGAELIGNEVTG
jgi:hypothetical protein